MSVVPEHAVCDSEEDLASEKLFAGKGSWLPRRLLLSRPLAGVLCLVGGEGDWNGTKRGGERGMTIHG